MVKRPNFFSLLITTILCCWLWVSLSLSLSLSIPVTSLNSPINLSQFSLSDLGNLSEDLNLESLSLSLIAGTPATEILQLGFFEETKLPNLALDFILAQTGLSPLEITLDQLPFLSNFSLKELVSFIPGLPRLPLNQVPVLSALVQQQLGSDFLQNLAHRNLGNLIRNSQIGNLVLGNLANLDSFSLTSLPGLTHTVLSTIPGWDLLKIAEIPGLDLLPLPLFIPLLSQTPTQIPVALVDIAFGSKEAYRLNTVSGSYQAGFNVPCNQTNCAHLELGIPFKGKQWISGKDQQVRGGTGCLKGFEPTGRHPFGPFAKVVLINTNESTGTGTFALYFRFPFFCGKSPYIIGPFPFYQAREKDWIFLGF